jgi:hypothetical protein
MAYLRKEKETFEVDYPISKVWEAIPKALQGLDWTVEEIHEEVHHVKAKTKSNFMAYASVLEIDVLSVDEKTARVSIVAETPVTTITSLFYLGRAQDRINQFLDRLKGSLSD